MTDEADATTVTDIANQLRLAQLNAISFLQDLIRQEISDILGGVKGAAKEHEAALIEAVNELRRAGFVIPGQFHNIPSVDALARFRILEDLREAYKPAWSPASLDDGEG